MNGKYIKEKDERLSKRNKVFSLGRDTIHTPFSMFTQTDTGQLSMRFIHPQISNTSCSQRPPRSLGGSGNSSPVCRSGLASNPSRAPWSSGKAPKNQAKARGSISRGFAASGVGFPREFAPVGLDQAAPGSGSQTPSSPPHVHTQHLWDSSPRPSVAQGVFSYKTRGFS